MAQNASFKLFRHLGMAIDPIHVGAGGARLGRVDLSIVRDPATRLPIIPGSSLAGVFRAYVAMSRDKYPHCAGWGQARPDGSSSHCGKPDCPVCTVFGFATRRDAAGGFAGLASFSDAHLVLFPVPTRSGPLWVTSPLALRLLGYEAQGVADNALYRENASDRPLNLGWLLVPVRSYSDFNYLKEKLKALGVPDYVRDRLGILPDALFAPVVNSNLEVRTSVSINPETGAAEEHALFTYEALPRTTILYWEVVCKNPRHFKIGQAEITAVKSPEEVHSVVEEAYAYLTHLGIGGMGTRGMGRLEVIH
ncbi:MAG: type III-B CRISPR module RAMP protein Cmr4 [Clostridia bacterium]|jgi:CRISPR-associated protein Cmr4|nr:type III-B CRISPR module RAMP protein Cmr4 [Clostridia bacterium]MDH7572760.1 type III-B CRISPR module RAMP protein Cmr4 [Clostridia bacterium]